MLDPVLVIIIASCMTLTQFAMQLRENVTTSAYLRNFELMLDSIANLHTLLGQLKSFKGWGASTDGAKKSFQRLEDLLRKATALLQRCISARSKLLQLVSEHSLHRADFVQMHADIEQCLAAVPTATLSDALIAQITAVRQQLLATPFVESVTPDMRQQLQRLMAARSSDDPTAAGGDLPAAQLAEALGLDGNSGGGSAAGGAAGAGAPSSALRKEQEALALEKRKAQEGRDGAHAKLVDQVVVVLMRMERELALRRDRKPHAKPAGAAGTTASSTIFSPQQSRHVAPTPEGLNLLADSFSGMGVSPDARQQQRNQGQQGGGAGSSGQDQSRQAYGQEGGPGSRKGDAVRVVIPGDGTGGGAVSPQPVGMKPHPQQQQPAKSPRQQAVGGGAAGGTGHRGTGGAMHGMPAVSPRAAAAIGVAPRGTVTGAGAAAPSAGAGGGGGAAVAARGSAAAAPQAAAAAHQTAAAGGGAAASSGEQGVAQQIIRTLRLGTPDEKAQAAGLVGWHTKFSATNRSMFRSAGVIDALLPLAASQHPMEGKAADAAVRALGNLLADEDVRVELIGHLPQLVQALHRAETAAARSGMARIFQCIAALSEESCKVVVDAGAVPQLARLVNPNALPSSAPAPTGGAAAAAAAAAEQQSKQSAAETLARLSQCASRRGRIVAEGAVPPLVVLVKAATPPSPPATPPILPETLAAAVAALACLATVKEGRDGMANAIPPLVELLGGKEDAQLSSVLDCLLLLAKHSGAYRSSIRNSGGMKQLRNVLKVGPSDLHNKGMELLSALFA